MPEKYKEFSEKLDLLLKEYGAGLYPVMDIRIQFESDKVEAEDPVIEAPVDSVVTEEAVTEEVVVSE